MSDDRPISPAEAMAALMNVVAALAAPLMHGRALANTTCRQLFADIDAHAQVFLETVGSASIIGGDREVDTTSLVEMTEELRALLRAQSAADKIEPEVVATARAWFTAIGFGEPPGGWDFFTGEA